MFNLFKKSVDNNIYSPVNGEMIPLENVPDKVFAEKMMGDGVAFKLKDGNIYAPCDGEIAMVFPTKHAIGFVANNGAEILIHVGLDTVNLNGEGFELIKSSGKVKHGELVLKVDVKALEAKGICLDTPMVITNGSDVEMTIKENKEITTASVVMGITKK